MFQSRNNADIMLTYSLKFLTYVKLHNFFSFLFLFLSYSFWSMEYPVSFSVLVKTHQKVTLFEIRGKKYKYSMPPGMLWYLLFIIMRFLSEKT